jgi:hypothetical protein
MSAQDQRARDQAMAANLIKQGYPHGRRFTKGLSNIPDMKDVGSAAYRRRVAKERGAA